MRYYECMFNTTGEKIQASAKVRLKDYDYDNPITAVNRYVHKNIVSSVQFFMYREEGNMIAGIFCYQEDKISYKDAYNAVADLLKEVADIEFAEMEPVETTTYSYMDDLMEGKRRWFHHGNSYYVNSYNSFIYDAMWGNDHNDNTRKYGFDLDEKMITNDRNVENRIYDSSLLEEVKNIEEHANTSNLSGNLVHYVVAGNGKEAVLDMVNTILYSLAKADRISSNRIEIVSQMDKEIFKRNGNLEWLIQGNRGGAVVLDMTEKFGCDPLEYGMSCKYIENLVKKYKNDCLFIFTYNMDHPGFSYQLLPKIQNQVPLVKIKEGMGSKENAVAYLQELIKKSDYAEYANQAGEFMKTYRAKNYTQTAVLEAYEKFEPWCLNHNFSGGYSYNPDEEFLLERDGDVTASEKLDRLIGLTGVKKQIEKIIVTNTVEKERKQRAEEEYPTSAMHMIFGGNPGTAKTTVAKLFAGIAKDRGVLKSGAFLERGGNDYNGLDGAYVLRQDFKAAKGGVLFIDEAYAMANNGAITVLLQEMEKRREQVIVILAGYNERMQEFLERNEGLKSRIPYWVDFPDYSTEELLQILDSITAERGFTLGENVLRDATVILEKAALMDNFGNGRYVRNLLEKAIQNQSLRLMIQYESVEQIPEEELFLLTAADFLETEEVKMEIREKGKAKKELEDMIGLTSAKKIIRKALATFKMKKLYVDKGICKDRPSMHMVFTGNPGTAKTTTARLIAEILHDEKVLASGKFVEVGRADLIGQHVGETAPLVKKRFREAQGGVLFIDEAYSLCDNANHSYGDEAISTIVQEMENHREDVIVIFAGYPKEMEEFLERNPGMASRIAFQVEFEDYTTEELCDIAKLMLEKKQIFVTSDAMDKMRKILDEARKSDDYGNGRYVRRLLEEAEMNLAQRLSEKDEEQLSMEELTTVEACDIEEPEKGDDVVKQMGFVG